MPHFPGVPPLQFPPQQDFTCLYQKAVGLFLHWLRVHNVLGGFFVCLSVGVGFFFTVCSLCDVKLSRTSLNGRVASCTASSLPTLLCLGGYTTALRYEWSKVNSLTFLADFLLHDQMKKNTSVESFTALHTGLFPQHEHCAEVSFRLDIQQTVTLPDPDIQPKANFMVTWASMKLG